jgi:hypothetical protein
MRAVSFVRKYYDRNNGSVHLTTSIAWRCFISFVIDRSSRTPSDYIGYGMYLYFSGMSLRMTSERLAFLVKRNHVSIWNWIQKYKPQKVSIKRKKTSEWWYAHCLYILTRWCQVHLKGQCERRHKLRVGTIYHHVTGWF